MGTGTEGGGPGTPTTTVIESDTPVFRPESYLPNFCPVEAGPGLAEGRPLPVLLPRGVEDRRIRKHPDRVVPLVYGGAGRVFDPGTRLPSHDWGLGPGTGT